MIHCVEYWYRTSCTSGYILLFSLACNTLSHLLCMTPRSLDFLTNQNFVFFSTHNDSKLKSS